MALSGSDSITSFASTDTWHGRPARSYVSARRIMRVLVLGTLLPGSAGCTLTVDAHIAECKMEAMSSFAHLREPHKASEFSGLEAEYVTTCMKARGFMPNYEKVRYIAPSMYLDAELWQRDWRRFLRGSPWGTPAR